MEVYSGQGKLFGAKLDAHGNLGEKFWCGNVPSFKVDLGTGALEFILEELTPQNLEIICGSALKEVPVDFSLLENFLLFDGPDAKQNFVTSHPQMKMYDLDLSESAPFEYALVFDGVNTATSHLNSWKHFARLQLFRVVTQSGRGFQFINDDFATITIVGEAKKDESRGGKRGKFSWIDLHQESYTGLRTKDRRRVNEVFNEL